MPRVSTVRHLAVLLVPQLHTVGFVKLAIVLLLLHLLVLERVLDALVPAAADLCASAATLVRDVEDEADEEDDVEAYGGVCGVPLPVR